MVDQLEEAFARAVDHGERTGFLDAVCDIAAGHHGVAKVLVALRSDFYPALDVHRGIADAVAADQHRLLPLDADALRDVIILPAERVGLRVEPALVEQVLDDVEPGTNQLPLVAFAMRETWRRRRNGWLTLAGYVDAGGVREALENGARSVWDGLSAEQRATAKRILLRLTSTGEGRAATRQRVMVDGLVTDRDDLDAVVDVLERFTRERLVVPDQDDAGRPTVDIAHEALLREWSVMRGWLEDDLDARRLQRDLSEAARAWDEAGREPTGLFAGRRLVALRDGRRSGEITFNETESAFVQASERRAKRDRRRTVLLALLPIGLALALVIVGLVVVQQRRTAEQKTVADSLQLAAESRSLIGSRRDAVALLAVAALNTDENQTTLGTLIDSVGDPDGPLAYSVFAGVTANVLARDFNRDGEAVIGMSDGSVRTIDPSTGEQIERADLGLRSVTALDVVDGTVVAGGSDGRIAIAPPDGSPPVLVDGPGGTIGAVRFDPTSGALVATTAAGTLSRWHVSEATVEPLGTSDVGDGIYAVELVTPPDGQPLAVVATSSGSLLPFGALDGASLPPIDNAFAVDAERPAVSLVAEGSVLFVQDGKGLTGWDLELGRPVPGSDDFAGATSLADRAERRCGRRGRSGGHGDRPRRHPDLDARSSADPDRPTVSGVERPGGQRRHRRHNSGRPGRGRSHRGLGRRRAPGPRGHVVERTRQLGPRRGGLAHRRRRQRRSFRSRDHRQHRDVPPTRRCPHGRHQPGVDVADHARRRRRRRVGAHDRHHGAGADHRSSRPLVTTASSPSPTRLAPWPSPRSTGQ